MHLSQRRPWLFWTLVLLALVGIATLPYWVLRGRGLADSRDPAFADRDDRVEWIADRIHGGPPTPILDAWFLEHAYRYKGSHMGPAWTMRTMNARLELRPGDGGAWAAKMEPHRRIGDGAQFGSRPGVPWGFEGDELDGAGWYVGDALFGKDCTVAISADGSKLFVYRVVR